MSDLDLERLGNVWRQEPDPAELAELRRAAETVRRRARWAQLADVVTAIAVALLVGFLILRNPQADTLLIGGGAILILLASHVRQRKLRAAELKSLTGTSEQMLDQAIERVHASQKRVRFGAVTLGPALLLGLLVAHSAGNGSRALAALPELRTMLLIGSVLVLALTTAHFWRSHRNNLREMERLTALRDAYRQEHELTSEE